MRTKFGIYWRLFRGNNLILTALTLSLMQYCIIVPLLTKANLTTPFSTFSWVLFIISILLIMAGGNCINDCIDVIADATNKKEKRIINVSVNKQEGLTIYYGITFLGVLFAIVPAWQIGSLTLFICFLLSAVLLFKYSYSLKRKPLIGNVVVSFLTAFCILLLCWANIRTYWHLQPEICAYIFHICMIFSSFAFIFTLIRELIKTMEDVRGDCRAHYNTIAIRIGIKKTKKLTLLLITIALLGLFCLFLFFLKERAWVMSCFTILGIMTPTFLLFYKTTKIKNSKTCHQASVLSKLIMFSGVLAAIPSYHFVLNF